MIEEQLRTILVQLQEAKKRYASELENAPEGKLMFMKENRGKGWCYRKIRRDGRLVREGITKDHALIAGLARKELITKAIPVLERNESVIKSALEQYEPYSPDAIISKLSPSFQNIPREFFYEPLSDGVFLELDADERTRIEAHRAWGNEKVEPSDYMAESRTVITSRGERMRSKSEALIAEKLYGYGIPFRYEQELQVDGAIFHPDFTFEGAGGNLFYLEFCGMMEDEKYVTNHVWKAAAYQKAGIVPWKNIIYLYAKGNELDMRRVESLIKTQIIPWL